jgi:hypothetical protein
MSLFFAGLAAFAPVFARAGEPAPAPAPEAEPPGNWIDITIGGFSTSGNDAALQRRMSNNGDFYGGIRSFQYEQAGDDGTFTVDGHALFGLNDYELNLGYVKDDVGFIRGGYREFRTWYDGSGGFVENPTRPGWRDPITQYDDELHLDRGEVWIEAGLTLEKLPEIIFGYSHRWREGRKDSTMWGISDYYGGEYGYTPGYYDIDETRDTFTIDVTHTLGNTDLALGLRADFADNDNTRILEEAQIDHNERYSYDLFGASMSSTTRFNDRMMLSFGYMFTTMDTDIGGSRTEGGDFSGSHSFPDVGGGAEFQQNVLNGNFWWSPVADLVIVPSVRAEWQDSSGYSRGFLDGDLGASYEDRMYSNDTDITETTEALEIRYSGFENVLFYASAEWAQNDEELDIVLMQQNAANLTRESWRETDISTDTAKYSIGANWYPLSGLSAAAQYYHKNLDQDFDNKLGGTFSALDAELYHHGYETDDANVRVTWRALPNLTFVTRYDYQQTDYENRAYYNGYVLTDVTSNIDSAEITRHILSESVTWNVNERFYVQGSVHWINSKTKTPAAKGPNGVPEDFIPNWDNDYFIASANAGYSIDSKTDVTASYTYYSTEGYQGVTDGMSYGLNTTEQVISLTLNRLINANMACYLSYGFITSNTDPVPDQSGGYNDFDAHMISTGLQVRF